MLETPTCSFRLIESGESEFHVNFLVLSQHYLLRTRVASCGFTVQLSRGGLIHPSKDMFDLAQYLYSYYEQISNKSCTNRLMEAFRLIQETIYCSYTDSVLRRFANSFSKGFARKKTTEINIDKQQRSAVKRKRLGNG